MCKTRPAGQVWPATRFCPAREMFLNNLEEEGLPTSFDANKRNIVVIDDLMAETDERVTNLFTEWQLWGTFLICINPRWPSLKLYEIKN